MEPEVELIIEKFQRLKENLEGRIRALEAELNHQKELDGEIISNLKKENDRQNEIIQDHETRIRIGNDQVVALKTTQTLGHTILGTLTLITGAIATWLGLSK